MDQKYLSDAILGNRSELFDEIWPAYKLFIEEHGVKNMEAYFLDKSLLVGDFFHWLKATGHEKEFALIDRRNGIDRRGDPVRIEAPGRRTDDQIRAREAQIKISRSSTLLTDDLF
jgi:hypothetical protein